MDETVKATLSILDIALRELHTIADDLMTRYNSRKDPRLRDALDAVLAAQQSVITAYDLTDGAHRLADGGQNEKTTE